MISWINFGRGQLKIETIKLKVENTVLTFASTERNFGIIKLTFVTIQLRFASVIIKFGSIQLNFGNKEQILFSTNIIILRLSLHNVCYIFKNSLGNLRFFNNKTTSKHIYCIADIIANKAECIATSIEQWIL